MNSCIMLIVHVNKQLLHHKNRVMYSDFFALSNEHLLIVLIELLKKCVSEMINFQWAYQNHLLYHILWLIL